MWFLAKRLKAVVRTRAQLGQLQGSLQLLYQPSRQQLNAKRLFRLRYLPRQTNGDAGGDDVASALDTWRSQLQPLVNQVDNEDLQLVRLAHGAL